MSEKMFDSFVCSVGVRQGENLSPFLFAYYVNDTEEQLIEAGRNDLVFSDELFNSYLKLFASMWQDVMIWSSVINYLTLI